MENVSSLVQESSSIMQNVEEKSMCNVQEAILVDKYAIEAHALVDKVIEKCSKNIASMELSEDDVRWPNIEDFTLDIGIANIKQFIESWDRGSSWLYCIQFLCEDVFKYSKRYRFKVQWSIPTRRKPIPRATVSVYFTIVASTIKPKHFPCEVYYIFEASKLVHRNDTSCSHHFRLFLLVEVEQRDDGAVVPWRKYRYMAHSSFDNEYTYSKFYASKARDTLAKFDRASHFTYFPFRPGNSAFREKWLKDVVDSKIILMETVTF